MRETPDPRWRRWGGELRRLRELAGLSQSEMGAKVHLSKSMVSGLERGTRRPKSDLSEELDSHLSTGGALSRLWRELSQQRNVPEWFRDVVLLERRALEIRQWQPILVPGLLQTADYARCLFTAWRLRASPDEIERLVEARVARLPALKQRPLLRFVIAESVFKVPVGPARILTDQIAHILRLVDENVIRVQVLPQNMLGPGPTPPYRVIGLDSGYIIYAEHTGGGAVIEKDDDVRFLMGVFGEQQAAAMSPEASVAWLKERGRV